MPAFCSVAPHSCLVVSRNASVRTGAVSPASVVGNRSRGRTMRLLFPSPAPSCPSLVRPAPSLSSRPRGRNRATLPGTRSATGDQAPPGSTSKGAASPSLSSHAIPVGLEIEDPWAPFLLTLRDFHRQTPGEQGTGLEGEQQAKGLAQRELQDAGKEGGAPGDSRGLHSLAAQHTPEPGLPGQQAREAVAQLVDSPGVSPPVPATLHSDVADRQEYGHSKDLGTRVIFQHIPTSAPSKGQDQPRDSAAEAWVEAHEEHADSVAHGPFPDMARVGQPSTSPSSTEGGNGLSTPAGVATAAGSASGSTASPFSWSSRPRLPSSALQPRTATTRSGSSMHSPLQGSQPRINAEASRPLSPVRAQASSPSPTPPLSPPGAPAQTASWPTQPPDSPSSVPQAELHPRNSNSPRDPFKAEIPRSRIESPLEDPGLPPERQRREEGEGGEGEEGKGDFWVEEVRGEAECEYEMPGEGSGEGSASETDGEREWEDGNEALWEHEAQLGDSARGGLRRTQQQQQEQEKHAQSHDHGHSHRHEQGNSHGQTHDHSHSHGHSHDHSHSHGHRNSQEHGHNHSHSHGQPQPAAGFKEAEVSPSPSFGQESPVSAQREPSSLALLPERLAPVPVAPLRPPLLSLHPQWQPRHAPLPPGAGRGRILFVDAQTAGASGDMLVGALLDLGVPPEVLAQGLRGLSLDGFTCKVESTERCAIVAPRFQVEETAPQPFRDYAVIRRILAHQSGLSPGASQIALRAFELLAEAEASVHGVPMESVHFHEVGAIDSIVDIVSVSIALDYLGLRLPRDGEDSDEEELGGSDSEGEESEPPIPMRVAVSMLPMGRGIIRGAAHGPLPCPAPATLEILCRCGIPTFNAGIRGELVTPTGACLLGAVALDGAVTQWPSMIPERASYGAGTKSWADRPNLLRLVLGRPCF